MTTDFTTLKESNPAATNRRTEKNTGQSASAAMYMFRHGISYLFILVLMLPFLNACAASNSLRPPQNTEHISQPSEEPETAYRMQLGDVIQVKFFYSPELNEEVTIRPDGKISLQLVDDIPAAGLSPSELDQFLTEKYTGLLRSPEVTIIVKKFNAQKIYVGGEVVTPGMVPIDGRLTAIQAIFEAGGFKRTGKKGSVVVLRKSGGDKPLVMILDLKSDLVTLSQNNDITLQPYDVVFVPRTFIAKVNQFVDQYIEEVVPFSLNFGFSYLYNLRKEVQVKQ